jgi:hypothetical protein
LRRDRLADAAGCAGDERDLAVESDVHGAAAYGFPAEALGNTRPMYIGIGTLILLIILLILIF